MHPLSRDQIRRGVRAAVYRACWRRLDGDEAGAQAVLACEVPAALAPEGEAPGVDDAIVQGWLQEDMADFDRAVLISELVARRTPAPAAAQTPAHARAPARAMPAPADRDEDLPRPVPGSVPAIADLLDGMLAQERRMRAAS